MMDRLNRIRKVLFIVALALIALIVLVELGSMAIVEGANEQISSTVNVLPEDSESKAAFDKLDNEQKKELENLAGQKKPPGIGIRYLALIDGILLFTVALIALSFIITQRVHGRIQGTLTLIFSIIIIILSIVLVFLALATLMLMIILLLSVPFGTLVYLFKYGSFDTGTATAILSLLMALKVGFVVCLVLANQRYLQNKGLVLLMVTSFIATIIVGFLHGFVPSFLVSITDAISGIVVAIIAIIWALILLIGSIPAIALALKLSRA